MIRPRNKLPHAFLLLGSGAVLLLMLVLPSMAVGDQSGFETLLRTLRNEALNNGIRQETLDLALAGLEPIPRVVELDRKQPESTLTLHQYLSRVVKKSRIARGRRKLNENHVLLNSIAERYGVAPHYLVALWGVESDFGKSTGSYPAIGSLVTLIYDGRRSAFFRKELLNALWILDQGHISVSQMKGSWAGAMGQLQFMPSTFRHFAVDFDGDGRIDIWNSLPDIFASAANYLARSGWKKDQTWGLGVHVPNPFDQKDIGLDTRMRTSEWQARGVRPLDGRQFPRQDRQSSIVQPDGSSGQAFFLVYDNYRTLLRWNRSHFFAIAVGMLSDQIGLKDSGAEQ